MVLPFKDQFVAPIGAGTKIHTIREDKHNRWRAGRKIHMATGVRTPSYYCFNDKDFCTGTQLIEFTWQDDVCRISIDRVHRLSWVLADKPSKFYPGLLLVLSENDGFDDPFYFLSWFNSDFSGKIIHWTDFRYQNSNSWPILKKYGQRWKIIIL